MFRHTFRKTKSLPRIFYEQCTIMLQCNMRRSSHLRTIYGSSFDICYSFFSLVMRNNIISDMDDCLLNNCTNGATCVDGIDMYTCQCVHGYTGDHCEAGESYIWMHCDPYDDRWIIIVTITKTNDHVKNHSIWWHLL